MSVIVKKNATASCKSLRCIEVTSYAPPPCNCKFTKTPNHGTTNGFR